MKRLVRGSSARYGAWQQAALRQYRAQYRGISAQLYRETAKEPIQKILDADTASFNYHQKDLLNQEREVDVRQDFNLFRNSGKMTSGQAWETVVTKWKGSIGEKRVNDILADQLNGGFDTGETTLAQASELWNSKLSNGKTFSSEYGYLWEGGLGEIEKRIVQGQKEKLDRDNKSVIILLKDRLRKSVN